MITTLGPAPSWRLIHDGKTVLLLAELSGYTETAHTAFEAATQQECVAMARSLALAVPDDMAELFAIDVALPAEVPESVTRAQGKAALITAGLWPGVLAFVAAIPDPTERALAEVALHDTQQWHRSSPFFNAAADALGLTGEQLDALFLAASKIEL